MPFIGNQPAKVPLTSADIADSIITSAKIVDATIANADIANSTINLTTKVTGSLPVANGGTGLTALGTAGQALVVNSGATALQYSTVGASAGQVIQVVSATDSTGRSTTSTSFVTASNTLSVSITPSSISNKILVIVSGNLYQTIATKYAKATIYRGATDLGSASSKGLTNVYANPNDTGAPLCMTILDSPATTASTTYQVYILSSSGGTTHLNEDNCKGSITVMEIKG